MERKPLNIGIALSGGGVRAAVFHLGVLGRLATDSLLENITFISTVSGGTLVTGLIYSISENRWPSSKIFLSECIPQAKQFLTKTSLQREVVFRFFFKPWFLYQGKAKLLSESIRKCWSITEFLKNISTKPRWIINATAYESGKSWRFTPQRMGDYILNYVRTPHISLSDAMAASAAYPGLIGPLKIKTNEYSWFRFKNWNNDEKESFKPNIKSIHLWDGGVYDNLGVEPLFKFRKERYRKEYNFLIVSDASKGIEFEKPSFFHKRAFRLVNIAMDQVRSLRARTLVSHFQDNPNSGVYLKIGNSSHFILSQSGMQESKITAITENSLSKIDTAKAANVETTLRKLTESEFSRLYQHGWEVANYTLLSRCPDCFSHKENLKML